MAVLLTGDRPSGPLHLGHYVGSLQNRLRLQDSYDSYIMIADGQALTDHFQQPEKVREAILEVARDYLAIGLNPEKCTIFVQSCIPEISELMFYFLNLVTLSRLTRNPTVKAEIQQKNLKDNLTVGFACYPISQAADITAFSEPGQTIAVPVGEDQAPMIEQTNEIVRKFNQLYQTTALSEARIMVGAQGRLVGIDGGNKASKSLNNAIFLKDDTNTVREKVFRMFTDPNHIHVQDPGNPDGHVVLEYLLAFHPEPHLIQDLREHYRRGGVGDVALKKMLFDVLENFLTPIRERRKNIDEASIISMLHHGNKKAREKVKTTLERVRHALGLFSAHYVPTI